MVFSIKHHRFLLTYPVREKTRDQIIASIKNQFKKNLYILVVGIENYNSPNKLYTHHYHIFIELHRPSTVWAKTFEYLGGGPGNYSKVTKTTNKAMVYCCKQGDYSVYCSAGPQNEDVLKYGIEQDIAKYYPNLIPPESSSSSSSSSSEDTIEEKETGRPVSETGVLLSHLPRVAKAINHGYIVDPNLSSHKIYVAASIYLQLNKISFD